MNKDFPSQFYNEDNPNFKEYKQLETLIYNNRNKIIQLQNLIQPFANSRVQVTDPDVLPIGTSKMRLSRNQLAGLNQGFQRRNYNTVDEQLALSHYDEYSIPSES